MIRPEAILEGLRLRNRAAGLRLRFEHPDDARAFLFRCGEFLAEQGHEDAQMLAEALLSLAIYEAPPDFENLLGIPGQWPGKAMSKRNEVLRKVARELGAGNDRAAGREIARQWRRFVGGMYRLWAEDGGPPDGASHLNFLLFHATRLNDGQVLGDRQIANVLAEAD